MTTAEYAVGNARGMLAAYSAVSAGLRRILLALPRMAVTDEGEKFTG